MFGYSKAKNLVFVLDSKEPAEPVRVKVEIKAHIVRLKDLKAKEWSQLKRLQGWLSVWYLRLRYSCPNSYVLLGFAAEKLVHVEWIIPSRKLKARYPFVSDNSYSIISCLTAPAFRGRGIYPSQIQTVVQSDIPAKSFWIWTPSSNISSLRGISKAGGMKVGQCVQKKWLWGCISRIKYYPGGSNNNSIKDESFNQAVFKKDYWISRGSRRLLTYIGPRINGNLQVMAVRKFVREKGAWGAMWNFDHDYTDQGPWYRCICDNADYDESVIKSKNTRHNLRRGLKRCVVRCLDYLWLADNAYNVYANAAGRYKDFILESKKEFQKQMRNFSQVPGREAWGVFVGEKLVAYLTLFIHGETVFGDFAHFDPAYANAYPMYALYYTVAYHYLREKGLKEFNRGTRPLMHETNVDEFLLRLGYRKSYCRLGLYFIWPVRVALFVARVVQKGLKLVLPSRYNAILKGLLLAQDIAKATNQAEDITYSSSFTSSEK